jgi:hypothetical protein
MTWKKFGSTAMTSSVNCRSPAVSVIGSSHIRVIAVTSGISARIAGGIGNGVTASSMGARLGTWSVSSSR